MSDRALAIGKVLRCVHLVHDERARRVLSTLARRVIAPDTVSNGALVLAQERIVKATKVGSEREVAAVWALFWAAAPRVNLAAVDRATEIALNGVLR